MVALLFPFLFISKPVILSWPISKSEKYKDTSPKYIYVPFISAEALSSSYVHINEISPENQEKWKWIHCLLPFAVDVKSWKLQKKPFH